MAALFAAAPELLETGEGAEAAGAAGGGGIGSRFDPNAAIDAGQQLFLQTILL